MNNFTKILFYFKMVSILIFDLVLRELYRKPSNKIYNISMVAVAQLVRAPDCGSGGRGFETHQPPEKN